MQRTLLTLLLVVGFVSFTSAQDDATVQGATKKQKTSPLYVDATRSIGVKIADPEEVAKTLNAQFPGFSFSANASTKRIYYRGGEDLQAEVEQLVLQIEEDAKRVVEEHAREKAVAKERQESEDRKKAAAAESQLLTLPLKHIEGKDFARTLEELEMLGEVAIAVHNNGSVSIRGSTQRIDAIVKLAEVLDVPMPNEKSATGMLGVRAGDQVAVRNSRFPPGGPKGVVLRVDRSPPSAEDISNLQQQYEVAEKRVESVLAKESDSDGAGSKELTKAITDAFHLRQKLQRAQIAVHRAKLDSMSKRIAMRDEISDQIIAARRKELLAKKQANNLTKAARSAAGGLKGEVQIEVFENEAIVLRGRKEDVGRVMSVIEKIEKPGISDAGPEKQTTDDPPRPFLLRRTKDGVTLTADSPEQLETIVKWLPKWEWDAGPVESSRGADGRIVQFGGTSAAIDRITEILTDMQQVAALARSLNVAKDVQVRLFGPAGVLARLTFGDGSYVLPAELKLDAGHRLPLTITGIPGYTTVEFFATLQIDDLDQESRRFFQLNRLPLAISIADCEAVMRGKTVTKSYHLDTSGALLQIRSYSTTDLRVIAGEPPGKRVAQLVIGNQKPLTSMAPVTSNKQVGGVRDYSLIDSILFVEAIVVAEKDDGSKEKRAFYSRGTVVGDDGLFVLALGTAFPQSEQLPQIESMTVKSNSGVVVTDARVVGYDEPTRLVLVQSNQLPDPALSVNGPSVVPSQSVDCVANLSSTESTFVQVSATSESPVFTLARGGFVVGSPVLLTSTGQLVGVVGADEPDRGHAVVIPVATIRKLVSEYRQADFGND